jgi:hypothetical protein
MWVTDLNPSQTGPLISPLRGVTLPMPEADS